jgi:hypothetical protein
MNTLMLRIDPRGCKRRPTLLFGSLDSTILQHTGVPQETDWGNFAGSVLMLSMMHCFQLDIFGAWPSLLEPGQGRQRSGKGPDNRRTNALEALLNDWQGVPRLQPLRKRLLQAWRLTLIAAVQTCDYGERSHECFMKALSCDDSLLPRGPLKDTEVQDFVQLRHQLGARCDICLAQVPAEGALPRRELAQLFNVSRGSKTVRVLERLLWPGENWAAPVRHSGSLLRLCFASARK